MSGSSFTLIGKVAIITGASGNGIGKATALLLASKGVRLGLAARSLDKLEEAAGHIRQQYAEASIITVPCDVSKRDDVKQLIRKTYDSYGQVDFMISNAGIMPTSLLEDLEIDKWDAMIDVNLKGVTNAIAATLPIFQKQSSGHFITVASTSGLKVVPTQAVYASTKHAVRTIMEGLRQEVAPKIRSTIITPGITLTDGVQRTKDGKPPSQQIQEMLKIAMDPMAVAKCILFAMEQPPEVNIGEIVVRSSSHR
jgi:NADP-dependent 3-hydroxy acid dehydrogenase YdfG